MLSGVTLEDSYIYNTLMGVYQVFLTALYYNNIDHLIRFDPVSIVDIIFHPYFGHTGTRKHKQSL